MLRQKILAGLFAGLSVPGLAIFLTILSALPPLSGLQPCGLDTATAAPLLQEGRKTIYQRVISHPGARIMAAPAANAAVVREQVVPFTVFYVHARKKGWIQVGPLTGEPEGWIEAGRATDWNQSLTLLFTPRTGRDPVMFFRSVAELDKLCAADDMKDRLAKLNSELAASGNREDKSGGSPVVATEPPESQGAVSAKRFYLMPILDMKDPYQGVKFLKVASIDPGNSGGKDAGTAGNETAGTRIPPRTGIALVIDTTISMKAYIDQSLNVVRKIYDRIEKEGLTDSVGFAVVAFRNSTKATPGLEYETRVVSDFATAKDRKSLESRLAQVRQASVSSHDFNEDSLAGVRTAVESLSWDGYASRLVLLISDAGPLKNDDLHATSGMGVSEVSDLARQKGIWVTILHVKTPRGQANHAYAEQSYRILGRRSDNHSNYLAVKAPSPEEGARQFGSVAQTLANGMLKMVKDTAEGRIMTRPTDDALAASGQGSQAGSEDAGNAEAARLAATLGYAMQLEYLGKLRANRAPTVVNSWIADMDLAQLAANEQVPSVEVAVLLTKNQLNDLAAQLRTIIDNAERTKKTDSRDFFQGILSASARMARDPNMPTSGKSLAELGILGEFLEGLPYKSDIMLLREEDWYRMSIGQQTAFVNRLKSRLARYDAYDQDRANWESFGQQNSGDWVYRVPLNMLP